LEGIDKLKKTIEIDGIIGWDFGAKDIRLALKEFSGEDLEININSPGGIVTEGLAIFNYIKNYSGKKVAKISGLCASMASYIALATDFVIVEENSIFMIHNATLSASGDYNDLQKASDISYRMSKILLDEYSRKTGMEASKIKKLMDEETFFYGKEILDAGFADFLVPSEKVFSRDDAIVTAQASVSFSDSLIKKITISDDNDQICAFFSKIDENSALQKAEKNIKYSNIMENCMNFDQIKEKVPEKVEEISNSDVAPRILETVAIEKKAREEERNRISGLFLWKGISSEGDAIILEAIASGKKSEDVAQQLYILSQKKSKLDEDNAEIVKTATTDSASGASGQNGLDEDDLKACEIFGIKIDDYKKVKEI
jgi:ATP-dependent protease ClpP protease subunit